jgi:hypothetical protein
MLLFFKSAVTEKEEEAEAEVEGSLLIAVVDLAESNKSSIRF